MDKVDAFLNNNPGYLNCLPPKTVREIILKYLGCSFVPNEDFIIIKCMKDLNINLNDARKMLKESNYINTMSLEYLPNFLYNYYLYYKDEEVVLDYINNLNDGEILQRIIYLCVHKGKSNRNIGNNSNICEALIKKAAEFQNVDLTLLCIDNYPLLLQVFDSNKLNIKDIKKYILSNSDYNNDVELLTVFRELDSNLLDTLFEVLIKKIRAMNKKDADYYMKQFFKGMISTNKYNENSLDYLALKIDSLNNISIILLWLMNTKCSANYFLLDKYFDSINCNILLDALDKGYIKSIFLKYIHKNKFREAQEFIKLCIANLDKMESEVTTLLKIGRSYPNLLDEESILKLIRFNNKYIIYFVYDYDLSEKIRFEILNIFKKENKYDLAVIYGAYLISGDKTKLLNEREIEKSEEMRLSLKNVK